MNALMDELDRVRARGRRIALLVTLALVAAGAAWLTGPYGIVLVLAGEPMGWVLVAAGAIFLVVAAVCIVRAVRRRAPADRGRGKANPRFDEPDASQDPRPGGAWIGSGLGSR